MHQGQIPFGAAPSNLHEVNQPQASTQSSVTHQQLPKSTNHQQSQEPINRDNRSQPGTNLRQRTAASRSETASAPSSSTERNTVVSNITQPAVTSDTWAIVLILLISLVVSSLIARRLYITYEYKFDDSSFL